MLPVEKSDANTGWSPALTAAPHTELFAQGDAPQAVFLIEEGLVKVSRVEENGNEAIVGLRRKDWVLGWAAALLGRPHPTAAETVEPCRLRHLRVADYHRLVRTDTAESLRLHRVQGLEYYERVQTRGLRARDRLERFLREEARQQQPVPSTTAGPVRFQLPLRQWELALLIGVTREHLSRMLRQLQREGCLLRRKGWFVLPDPGRLHAC